MICYDMTCPVCGRVDHDLYLEETDGWMECEYCGNSTQSLTFMKIKKLPIFQSDQVKEIEHYLAQLKETG